MDMLCHCGWVSRPAPWSPLPYEFRPISPQTKQAILRGVIHKATAQKMRDQLDVAARGAGAAVDDRNSVLDQGLVPPKKRIQQLMTDHRRSGRRRVPAFEVIDRILRCVCGPLLFQWMFFL
jgi:hypothetical protein